MAKSVAFWFRRKYNLPPTDPRFLDVTVEEMATDFWAHHFADNPEAKEVVDETFDVNEELAKIDAEAAEETLPDDFEDI